MLTTEDFTQLMWQNYDRMNALLDQQSIPAQERMIYQRFKREYTVFRLAHFNSRVIELDPRAELPTGSVVHLLDDVLNVEHSDVPDLSRFPLVMNESFIKFISHIRGYVDGPVHIDDHYILRMAGLPTALMSFRSRHAHDFRFVAEWQNLPTKEQCLCVINHNPIFRMYVMGRMKYFRKLQLCLASILNTVHQCLQMAKKHQFIFIPWGEEFFARTEFIRSKRKLDIGSVKHPENFHYILMMHILNFFADGATTSIFQQIPQDDLPYINLVLNHNGKYVIYNLGDLTTLNSRGLVYLRACNQMNLLAVASRVQPDTNPEVKDFYTKSIITTAQQAEGVTEPQVDTHGNVVPTLPHDQPVTKVIEGVTPEAAANVPQETSALTPEERTEQAISAMAKNIPQQKKIAPTLIEPHLPPATSVVRSTKKDEKPVVKGTLQLNQTSIQETANTVDNFTASFTEETDAAMDEFIDNAEHLTPKQKALYKQLGRKYEKLTLDGVSLKEILTTPDDLSLADTKLGANVVGDNPMDPSIANCSLTAYDEAYMRSTYRKQFVGAITAFRKQGLFLTDLKQELYQDPINCVNIYTLKFTDIRGKSSTIRLRLPKIDRHNRFKIDGIQKVLKKQRINLPIVKISETEVSISSNYNKCRVIRDVTKAHGYDGYMTGLLDQKRSSATVVLGKFHTNAPISYEYSILADRYSSISFKGSDERHYDLYFDYNHRQTHFLGKPKIFERCEEEYGTFFGTVNDDCLFVDVNNEVRTVSPTGAELVDRPVTTIANLCKLALRPGQKYDKVQSEYVNLVTLDGKFPLVFVLAYRFGLRHMLDYMNVKYTIIDRESKEIVSENVGTASFGANIDTILDTNGEPIEGTDWIKIAGQEDLSDNVKYKRKDTDIAIKFKDRILYFNRYPLTHSLILAGLDLYDLSKYELSEFEGKEVYYQILLDCDMSMNYIKGLDSFFDLFIDNMTYNVLKAMHEPTNMRDLLIRATQLLTTTDVRDAASNYNFRIRGYEQFNAIIYNEMSRAVAKYQANKSKANTFSINPEAVYLRIVQNQAVIPTDCANPMQDIKETADMTFTGIGGRDAESFVIDDRKFTSDSTGTMAIDTNDTGKVGLQAQLSLNSGISNTEGILSTRPIDSLQPADVLSIHSLTFPFATHDDSKRINFVAIQSVHMLPLKYVDKWRVRTGYERIVAHRAGKDFAGVAKMDGEVTNMDEKIHMVEVTYKDGSIDVFQYGEKFTEHESVSATQNLECIVQLGQKVKKGDIIMYNKNFFTLDPLTKQVDFSIGAVANVALIETDVDSEDATEISERLAKKLTIVPTNTRVVTLARDNVIHKCAKIGDVVNTTDDLVVFEDDATLGGTADSTTFSKLDQETIDLLGDLNRKTPKAKFNGTVVRIDAYYGGPISEMSESLQPIVKAAVATMQKQHKFAASTMDATDYAAPAPLPKYSKFKGVDFDETTVMLIFYIQEEQVERVGDKEVFGNQLKHTVSSIATHKQYTEDGEEIDAVFSCDAIGRRITQSPILTGIISRIVERVEKNALALYFDEDADAKK